MAIPIIQVDAFTGRPYSGNPAAVCITPEPLPEHLMRDIAQEMNLSETAFLTPEGGGYRLRWFTPAVEVDLCGHATLASAHVLWESGHLPQGAEAKFLTRSGTLLANRKGDWVELDFPATPCRAADEPQGLTAALGLKGGFAGQSPFDYLVEAPSEAVLRALSPDFNALKKCGGRGVIVTARASSPDVDFVSRFFAPAAGVDEDPVTGSAHCALGPYWAERLGKTEMIAYQASARGGLVRVTVRGDRVILGGQAVTVLRGELTA